MKVTSDGSIAFDALPIALRCYADWGPFTPPNPRKSEPGPSQWTVIFDTETRTDAAQPLRFRQLSDLRRRTAARGRHIL